MIYLCRSPRGRAVCEYIYSLANSEPVSQPQHVLRLRIYSYDIIMYDVDDDVATNQIRHALFTENQRCCNPSPSSERKSERAVVRMRGDRGRVWWVKTSGSNIECDDDGIIISPRRGNQISDSINKLLICMSLNSILLFCVFSLSLSIFLLLSWCSAFRCESFVECMNTSP